MTRTACAFWKCGPPHYNCLAELFSADISGGQWPIGGEASSSRDVLAHANCDLGGTAVLSVRLGPPQTLLESSRHTTCTGNICQNWEVHGEAHAHMHALGVAWISDAFFVSQVPSNIHITCFTSVLPCITSQHKPDHAFKLHLHVYNSLSAANASAEAQTAGVSTTCPACKAATGVQAAQHRMRRKIQLETHRVIPSVNDVRPCCSDAAGHPGSRGRRRERACAAEIYGKTVLPPGWGGRPTPASVPLPLSHYERRARPRRASSRAPRTPCRSAPRFAHFQFRAPAHARGPACPDGRSGCPFFGVASPHQ
eukprot:366471-Chlamydomonas_euryale.AAC.5